MRLSSMLLASIAAAAVAMPRDATPEDFAAKAIDLVSGTPPDRLSVDRESPHFSLIYKRIGIRFNGEERQGDVQAYDRVAGWIDARVRNRNGKFKLNGDGTYRLERLFGTVEPYFKKPAPRPIRTEGSTIIHNDIATKQAAEDKRAMRAAKRARLAT